MDGIADRVYGFLFGRLSNQVAAASNQLISWMSITLIVSVVALVLAIMAIDHSAKPGIATSVPLFPPGFRLQWPSVHRPPLAAPTRLNESAPSGGTCAAGQVMLVKTSRVVTINGRQYLPLQTLSACY